MHATRTGEKQHLLQETLAPLMGLRNSSLNNPLAHQFRLRRICSLRSGRGFQCCSLGFFEFSPLSSKGLLVMLQMLLDPVVLGAQRPHLILAVLQLCLSMSQLILF